MNKHHDGKNEPRWLHFVPILYDTFSVVVVVGHGENTVFINAFVCEPEKNPKRDSYTVKSKRTRTQNEHKSYVLLKIQSFHFPCVSRPNHSDYMRLDTHGSFIDWINIINATT